MNILKNYFIISEGCVVYGTLINQDVWEQVREGQIDPLSLKEMLESIRNKADVPLSIRSLSFLSLEPTQMDEFVQLHKHQPVKRQVKVAAHCYTGTLRNVVFSNGMCLLDGHHLHSNSEEEYQ